MINRFTGYKIVALCLLFAVMIYCIFMRLYDFQVTNGEELSRTSERRTTRTYEQKASRGEIYDRNGVPLVTNQMGFSLEFDYFNWDKDRQNETILQLCAVMTNSGEVYIDSLPVSKNAPFSYTYGENEKEKKKILDFIESQEDWSKDISASQLIDKLSTKYKIADTYNDEEKRIIAGVRYEMEERGFSSYTPHIFAKEVSVETVSKVSEVSMFMPGVMVVPTSTRKYETMAAAHILGTVGVIYKEDYPDYKKQGYPMNAIVGRDGAEKAFESYLRGIDGVLAVESNIDGEHSDKTALEEPIPGKDVYLTLDIGMQAVAEKALADTVASIKAKGEASTKKVGVDVSGGAAVVIDVKTGEILASASYPTYDISRFNADYNLLLENPLKPMINRAIGSAYPPGSIFKMVTALAVLEEGIVTPQSKIRDLGVYQYYAPTYTPACWVWNDERRTHGNINVSEAIKYSCNYFFFETSRQLGIEKLNKYAKMLGLGEKVGVEIAGEVSGNLAGPESRAEKGGAKWEESETIQAAIGQTEQQFTPMQLANYMATLINGGRHYQPHYLKKVVNPATDQVMLEESPLLLDNIAMGDVTLDAIKSGMRGVVSDDGTASYVFRDYPIEIGGKTGSVQTKKGSSAHGTFLSFAPYNDPEIAVFVILENGGSGGNVAPVVRTIYDYYFKIGDFAPVEPVVSTGESQYGGDFFP